MLIPPGNNNVCIVVDNELDLFHVTSLDTVTFTQITRVPVCLGLWILPSGMGKGGFS